LMAVGDQATKQIDNEAQKSSQNGTHYH